MKLDKHLKFFINFAALHARVARVFDTRLGNGLGFNDFVVLCHLATTSDQKLRRIDLAEKMSLSASGVTRMLLPMEKIGLVAREESEHDGRVVFVKLAPGGKKLLEYAMERAELRSKEILPSTDIKQLKDISEIFSLFSFNPIK